MIAFWLGSEIPGPKSKVTGKLNFSEFDLVAYPKETINPIRKTVWRFKMRCGFNFKRNIDWIPGFIGLLTVNVNYFT